jgi:hypothetical protein
MKMNFDMRDVEWIPADPAERHEPGDTPYATHHGVWNFMGDSLRVYRLNNGQTVIAADDFERVFGEMLGVAK